MTANEMNRTGKAAGGKPIDKSKPGRDAPGWTRGLRQLYDAVVDEPLPDNFKDLLSQLDYKD